MKVECPRCHTHVEMPLDGSPQCPTCGFGTDNPQPVPASPVAAAAPAYGSQPTSGWAPPASPGEQWSAGAPKPQLNQTMAITALVLGIVGCCIMGPLTGIPAAIVGGIAMKKAKQQPDVYGGNGMALAGLILGIIATIVGIITIIFYAAIFAMVADCEQNPESEFCQDLEGQNDPGAATYAPIVPVGTAAISAPLFFARPRPWHAG